MPGPYYCHSCGKKHFVDQLRCNQCMRRGNTVYMLAKRPPQESNHLPQILEWMESLRNRRSDRDVHVEFAKKYVYVYSGKWAIAAVNPLTGMSYKVKEQQGKFRATRKMLGTIDQLCERDCIS